MSSSAWQRDQFSRIATDLQMLAAWLNRAQAEADALERLIHDAPELYQELDALRRCMEEAHEHICCFRRRLDRPVQLPLFCPSEDGA